MSSVMPAPALPFLCYSGSSLPDTASLPSVGMAGTKVLRGAAGYSSSAGNSAADFAAIREAAAQAAKAQKVCSCCMSLDGAHPIHSPKA